MRSQCSTSGRQAARWKSQTPHLPISSLGNRSFRPVCASSLDQPAWSGDTVASRFVNFLINTKPIYAIMKVLAKQAMKNSADSRGVGWDAHVQRMERERSQLLAIQKEMENPSIQFPSYYTLPFHAYEEGNLSWLAAFEVEPATYAVSIRTYKDEVDLTPKDAFAKMRKAMTDAVKAYAAANKVEPLRKIVDMGCSTGMSTRWLAQEYPEAEVTGLDLSTFFLAVAEQEERKLFSTSSSSSSSSPPPARQRIQYTHGLAEASGIPSQSMDLVSFNFVIHECPGEVIENLIKESKRIVKPGGMLMFVDNNPKSKTIQELPPAIFTLMKSTEPHSDSYYSFDLEQAMRNGGFKAVSTFETDHRHRTVLGVCE